MTIDESYVAGQYHSCCTVSLDLKPVYTGCNLHTLCVKHGDIVLYKLFARCNGGKLDNDFTDTWSKNLVTDQKVDSFLHNFERREKSANICLTFEIFDVS